MQLSNKDEDDIYEFKSTPKDSSSSSGDDKSDGGKNSDKSSDEKSDDAVPSQKRTYSDLESNDDTAGSSVEDDVKRKKRKDGDPSGKDSAKSGTVSSRSTPQRSEKGSKAPGGVNKNLCTKVAAALDRKSPCPSPKPSNKSNDSDAETDENKSGDSFGSSGPKVPPLKIVIPQQSTGNDQETGTRNGKNASARSHAALPYVVPSSSNSNDSADKESGSSRCTSPSDSAKSTDDKKGSASGTVMTNEEQRQQRVLRSSHRGGQSVDRGSNNSSPQLQNSSPSPAPATGSAENETAAAKSTTAANNGGNASTGSPTNPSTATASDSDANTNAPSPSASSTSSSTKETAQSIVDLHPRKRKIRASKDDVKQSGTASANAAAAIATATALPSNTTTDPADPTPAAGDIHPHDQPITNCYQMYLNIRQQIDRRHRTLFPVQPKPPQGFKDYLMNRATYALAGKTPIEPQLNVPANLTAQMKELFTGQEKERHKLKMQHVVEKEKLVLSVEQEILRVHGRAARALANQSLPFSVCTILKDEEVYNMITPEQEEKDRNARSRYNGRLFISWLQDVDDKWEKIKVGVC